MLALNSEQVKSLVYTISSINNGETPMKRIVSVIGSLIGWTGVVLCIVTGLLRIFGIHYVIHHETMTIFTVAIAMIATGCLAKLEVS